MSRSSLNGDGDRLTPMSLSLSSPANSKEDAHHGLNESCSSSAAALLAETSSSSSALSAPSTDNNATVIDGSAAGLSDKSKKKKARTTFTGRQIFELEKQFEIKKYLSSSERSEMAKLLNVTETQVGITIARRSFCPLSSLSRPFGAHIHCLATKRQNMVLLQVKIWFQNRRTKWKKQEGITNAQAAEHRVTNEKTKEKSESRTSSRKHNKTDVPNGGLSSPGAQRLPAPVGARLASYSEDEDLSSRSSQGSSSGLMSPRLARQPVSDSSNGRVGPKSAFRGSSSNASESGLSAKDEMYDDEEDDDKSPAPLKIAEQDDEDEEEDEASRENGNDSPLPLTGSARVLISVEGKGGS